MATPALVTVWGACGVCRVYMARVSRVPFRRTLDGVNGTCLGCETTQR
jgi:hypothetical protein